MKKLLLICLICLMFLTSAIAQKQRITIENEVFELKGNLVNVREDNYITNAEIENLKVNGIKYKGIETIYLHTDFSEYGEPTRTVIRNNDLYIELVDGEVRYFWTR